MPDHQHPAPHTAHGYLPDGRMKYMPLPPVCITAAALLVESTLKRWG